MLTKLGQCALLAVLMVFVQGGNANAQSKKIVRDSVFERLTTNDGLPQQTIYDIAQDSFGFLWVATEGGLARYDGKDFRTWKPSNSAKGAISSGYITALAMGAENQLWIGTGDGGLNLLNVETMVFENITGEQGLVPAGIHDLMMDSKGKLWIGFEDGHIQTYDPAAKQFAPISLTGEPDEGVVVAIEQVGDRVWIAQTDLGAWHTDLTGGDAQLVEDDDLGFEVTSITSREGVVWIGSSLGVRTYNGATGAQALIPPSLVAALEQEPRVQALYWSTAGELWVGLADGLLRLRADDTVSRYESHIDNDDELSFPSVTAIYEDSFKNLWFGTSSNGLSLLDRYKERLGFVSDVQASGTAHYTTDTVHWVGTYPGSLNRVDRKTGVFQTWQSLPLDPKAKKANEDDEGDELEDDFDDEEEEATEIDLSGLWITSIVLDDQGRVWMSSDANDVIIYDPKTKFGQLARPNFDDELVPVWRLEKMRDGRILAATWGRGVVIFNPATMETTLLDSSKGLPDDRVYVAREDVKEDGILWIGGAAGLFKYSLPKAVGEVWDERYVTSIHQDHDGRIWAGTTDNGLMKVGPAKPGSTDESTTYDADSDNGLTSNAIYGVLEDDAGRLWITTNGGGLCYFEPEPGKFFCFGNTDGVLNEYAQNSYHKAADGTLFFGGPGGFNQIDPTAFTDAAKIAPPDPVFLKLMIENEEVVPGSSIWTNPPISLDYGESTAALEFAALNFEDNERAQFEYRIKGFQKDKWHKTSRRFIPIPNLGGGDYKIEIRVADRFGNWSEKTAVIKVSVASPWWLRWWAFLLYVVLMTSIVSAALIFQKARFARIQNETRLEAVEKDLALTGAVQTAFLPEASYLEIDTLRLSGFYRPAESCSGDWWWYEHKVGTKCTVFVGDVTGHGPGPAMVTAAVATTFHVLERNDTPLLESLAIVHEEVRRVGQTKYQMTMSALEIDTATGAYKYYSCGGLPMLSLVPGKKPRPLPCRGTLLGAAESKVGQIEGQFVPGERLMMMTDGIPEVELPNGKLLGMRRFARMAEDVREMQVDQSLMAIVKAADAVCKFQDDDWTLAVVEWKA